MITTKQRAFLRSKANTLSPIFQIGKDGVEDNVLEAISGALETRELIKINILNNSLLSAKEACQMICEELGCDPVQVIGSKVVIYRESKNNPQIELPKK